MAVRLATLLKNVWAKEPVLAFGTLSIIPLSLSPSIKNTVMINQALPYSYQCSSQMIGAALIFPTSLRTLQALAWSS
ncbi:NADH dehydrogenase [ubiquinone] 1 alpha subcomplex subunit 3 [Fukomys damarensis]|uniref:NADH dehydrogenase [ubiquinone] 1 alpha subcomplex subunit 3 n=1 Tax=Fukomys damarensis TaxID=885580 RepID=A0A091DX89_FUKDA|nr:NADH dehydrogenase [ubiquinone] 1 alpha subcomplex subunit 3 [Fukomys damarensis]